MQTIHNYILFPENLDDKLEEDKNLGLEIVRDFQMTIDLADCEIGGILYYSKSNKDKFFENLNTFEELSELNVGIYDFETVVNSMFSESGVFEVSSYSNDSDCKVVSYNSKKGGVDHDFPLIFTYILRKDKGLKEFDRQVVLNLFNCYFSQNPILLITDCKGVVNTLEIPFITKFEQLDSWLQENRIVRGFNSTDTRHIENSGNHRKDRSTGEYKSPLLGGIGGRLNGEELLKNALGDKRSSSNHEDLMNYDYSNDEYIWYEFENAHNTYHAYHLVKAFTHVRDQGAVDRISSRVIRLLNYRKEKSENG